MTKGLWVYCPSPMFVSKNPHFPILLDFFVSVPFLEQFPSCPPVASFFRFFLFQISTPNPVSTNLIHNLKLSLIYELPLAVLFFAVMRCLLQSPALLYISSVSLICYQVSLLPLEWPIWFSCLDLSFTSHKIFTSSFSTTLSWAFFTSITPFFTSHQVVFPAQFPVNYSCNIIMPSLVLLLCQLFAFAHNIRYCFTFLSLILQSGDWAVLSILCFT